MLVFFIFDREYQSQQDRHHRKREKGNHERHARTNPTAIGGMPQLKSRQSKESQGNRIQNRRIDR